MNAEAIERRAETSRKFGFFRPLVEKIRNLDHKWLLAGVAIGATVIGIALGASLQIPAIAYAGLGVGLVSATTLLLFTDALEIAPHR